MKNNGNTFNYSRALLLGTVFFVATGLLGACASVEYNNNVDIDSSASGVDISSLIEEAVADKRLEIKDEANGCFTIERHVGTEGKFEIPLQTVCPPF